MPGSQRNRQAIGLETSMVKSKMLTLLLIPLLALSVPLLPPTQGMGDQEAGVSEESQQQELEFQKIHRQSPDSGTTQKKGRRGSIVQLGPAHGYLSLPEEENANGGALILLHPWWGLDSHIKNWADRFARLGYAALAVDLYQGEIATSSSRASELMRNVKDATASRDIANAVRFLYRDERVQANRVGTIGWSFGGSWALRTAIRHPNIDACVVYYGKTPADPESLSTVGASILAIFGKTDPGIPVQQIDAFRKGLETAEVKHKIVVVDAGHGFADPSRPRYQFEAAASAWDQTKTFLELHLRRPEQENADPERPQR